MWGTDDPIPLSAIQHWLYCPRQCGLIHLESVWDENLYTLRGRRSHERVDEAHVATREGVRVEYSLPLWHEELGLTGVADAVEFDALGRPYPVEHKTGPRRARLADSAQLCLQALCLERMFGADVPEGAIYHASTRRRRVVAIDEDLRRESLSAVEAVRVMLASGQTPPPAADKRCEQCSLSGSCLPFAARIME